MRGCVVATAIFFVQRSVTIIALCGFVLFNLRKEREGKGEREGGGRNDEHESEVARRGSNNKQRYKRERNGTKQKAKKRIQTNEPFQSALTWPDCVLPCDC